MPPSHPHAPNQQAGGVIERIAAKMSSMLELHDVLATITDGLVDDLGAAFA